MDSKAKAKEALSQALKRAKTIRIDDTLNIFTPDQEKKIHKQAIAALKKGGRVTWEDGTEEWYTNSEVIDTTKDGSDMYTWNPSGSKVLNIVWQIRKDKKGKITKTKIGQKYLTP